MASAAWSKMKPGSCSDVSSGSDMSMTTYSLPSSPKPIVVPSDMRERSPRRNQPNNSTSLKIGFYLVLTVSRAILGRIERSGWAAQNVLKLEPDFRLKVFCFFAVLEKAKPNYLPGGSAQEHWAPIGMPCATKSRLEWLISPVAEVSS